MEYQPPQAKSHRILWDGGTGEAEKSSHGKTGISPGIGRLEAKYDIFFCHAPFHQRICPETELFQTAGFPLAKGNEGKGLSHRLLQTATDLFL